MYSLHIPSRHLDNPTALVIIGPVPRLEGGTHRVSDSGRSVGLAQRQVGGDAATASYRLSRSGVHLHVGTV